MRVTGLFQDLHGSPNYWRRSTTSQEAGVSHNGASYERVFFVCSEKRVLCLLDIFRFCSVLMD